MPTCSIRNGRANCSRGLPPTAAPVLPTPLCGGQHARGALPPNTYLWVREFGWPYLEKLAQQKVMQLQSAADPPKKIAIGERAVMADGNDYSLEVAKEKGQPVEVVHAREGSPVIPVPCGIFRSAPNPNAARLFQNFLFSVEAQQIFIDVLPHPSFHAA